MQLQGEKLRVNLQELTARAMRSTCLLEDTFLPEASEWGIGDARLALTVDAKRKANGYLFSMTLAGEALRPCDRCLEPMRIPLSYEGELSVVYGESESYEGEEWTILPSEVEVDLAPFVRETLYLLLPLRMVHGEGVESEAQCDPTMLEQLESCAHGGRMALDAETRNRLAQLQASLVDE